MRREHWALQASLTHCSNDDFLLASGLDASAFAVRALGRTGFAGGKICCVGVTSLAPVFLDRKSRYLHIQQEREQEA